MPVTLIWPRWGSRRLHHCNWPAQGQEAATLFLVLYPSAPAKSVSPLVEAAAPSRPGPLGKCNTGAAPALGLQHYPTIPVAAFSRGGVLMG